MDSPFSLFPDQGIPITADAPDNKAFTEQKKELIELAETIQCQLNPETRLYVEKQLGDSQKPLIDYMSKLPEAVHRRCMAQLLQMAGSFANIVAPRVYGQGCQYVDDRLVVPVGEVMVVLQSGNNGTNVFPERHPHAPAPVCSNDDRTLVVPKRRIVGCQSKSVCDFFDAKSAVSALDGLVLLAMAKLWNTIAVDAMGTIIGHERAIRSAKFSSTQFSSDQYIKFAHTIAKCADLFHKRDEPLTALAGLVKNDQDRKGVASPHNQYVVAVSPDTFATGLTHLDSARVQNTRGQPNGGPQPVNVVTPKAVDGGMYYLEAQKTGVLQLPVRKENDTLSTPGERVGHVWTFASTDPAFGGKQKIILNGRTLTPLDLLMMAGIFAANGDWAPGGKKILANCLRVNLQAVFASGVFEVKDEAKINGVTGVEWLRDLGVTLSADELKTWNDSMNGSNLTDQLNTPMRALTFLRACYRFGVMPIHFMIFDRACVRINAAIGTTVQGSDSCVSTAPVAYLSLCPTTISTQGGQVVLNVGAEYAVAMSKRRSTFTLVDNAMLTVVSGNTFNPGMSARSRDGTQCFVQATPIIPSAPTVLVSGSIDASVCTPNASSGMFTPTSHLYAAKHRLGSHRSWSPIAPSAGTAGVAFRTDYTVLSGSGETIHHKNVVFGKKSHVSAECVEPTV